MTQNNSDTIRMRLKATRAIIPAPSRERGSLLMRARLFTWFAMACDTAKEAGLPVPQTIGAYWPLSDEPDLRALMTQWDDNGITVALPVMTGRNQPLEFHRWNADMELSTGPFGVMEPAINQPLHPDVILVPTLGFTAQRDRIGYGQGFYDRTLEKLAQQGHHAVTIGIAWNEASIEKIQPDYRPADHDYRLDGVLTPDGWINNAPDYPMDRSKLSSA